MVLNTVAVIADILNEFNQSGAGPAYSLFQVAGISSGQIYDKITEANGLLQMAVGVGNATLSDAAQNEIQKRFEISYAAARLAQDLIGVNTTDGFNYNVAGVAVQRATPQLTAVKDFIDRHLAVAKMYLTQFNPWFYVYNPQYFEGSSVMGTPITYWSTSRGQY